MQPTRAGCRAGSTCPAALGAAFVVLPLVAMAVKVDWPHFWSLISSPSSTHGAAAEPAHAAGQHRGVPGAGRADGAGAGPQRRPAACGWLRPLILLPLVLPPVVGGIALLYTFGRLGLIGQYLDAAGIRIAFTTTAVVLAQTFVSLPFLVIALEGAARTRGPRLRGRGRDARVPDRRRCGGG